MELLGRIIFLALVVGCSEVRAACTKLDSCSCQDSATGEVLSLGPLASGDKTAALKAPGPDGQYLFEYNPCLPFTAKAGTQCENVAICQEDIHTEGLYSLGNQSTAVFVENPVNRTLSIRYRGTDAVGDLPRISDVQLICDKNAVEPTLKFLYENPAVNYHFELTSRCACVGECKQIQEGCTPEGSRNCACRLSDDGGLINLASLDQPSAPLIVKAGSNAVTMNLCTGIDVGPSATPCRDVTVCVERAGAYFDFGIADNFNYTTDHGQVMLNYASRDGTRRTSVELICDRGQRHYPKITIQGEPTSSELRLELRSVCACPGGCMGPQVTCERIDDCTCRLEDGSGTVSLHNLDNPVAPLEATSSDKWNSYNYYYNPCTKFTSPEPNGNCSGVAACQIIEALGENFNLGFQNGTSFRVSNVDTDIVTLHYVGGGDDRQTFVQLQCNATAAVPVLSYIDESPYRTYHLALESKDACPQRVADPQPVAKAERNRARTRI
ncbi:uncharacterized protein LOC135827841 [Sycon ciliatum]|uniref:uncharacterized protein LOC135827841 n=1 Tax=Sycon ciliatum TaxID=27933 RepID=UPI0031F68F39